MSHREAFRSDRPCSSGGASSRLRPARTGAKLRCRATLSVLLAFTWTAHADAALIRFHSTAQVDSPVVRLGDVAEIHDLDAETSQRLAAITLAPAPAPGRDARLEFGSIRSRLQSQGIDLAQIEFSGASVITISSREVRIEQTVATVPSPEPSRISSRERRRAEALLKPVVTAYLRGLAPEIAAATIALQFSDDDVPAILSAAGKGFEVSGGAPPWDQPQALQIAAGGEARETISVMCRITKVPYILAAKHALPARHVLQESDLVWIPQSGADAGRGTFDRPESVIGKETKHALRREDPIRDADIREIPLVRPNDIVSVYSRGPGITIRRQFKSRNEGAHGDTVTLVTLDGRQKVIATVTGYHEAEVIVPGNSRSTSAMEDATGRIQFVSESANGRERPSGNFSIP